MRTIQYRAKQRKKEAIARTTRDPGTSPISDAKSLFPTRSRQSTNPDSPDNRESGFVDGAARSTLNLTGTCCFEDEVPTSLPKSDRTYGISSSTTCGGTLSGQGRKKRKEEKIMNIFHRNMKQS